MVVNLRTREIDRRSDLRQGFIKAQEERRLKKAQLLNAEANGFREKNRRDWETWKQRVRDGVSDHAQPLGSSRTELKVLQGELPKDE
jgi:hypothetical protein